MKFLIAGCGSIGERHAKNLRTIDPDFEIDVFDPLTSRAKAFRKKHLVNCVSELALESKYDCAFICSPPSFHVHLAIRALSAGSNVFVEKPLSSNRLGISRLQGLVKRKNLLAFVGYNLRFNKGIHLIKQMINNNSLGKVIHASGYFGQFLPDWRPLQNYKNTYSARKDLGGGIVYDASHELDYFMWLFGKPFLVQAQLALTDILSADTDAIADILIKFHGGILGYIHLDFVRREYRRTLEVLFENGIIHWSLPDTEIKIFNAKTKRNKIIKLPEVLNDMYLAEIRHIINCIKTNTRSEIINLENGIATFGLSEAVIKSAQLGRRLSV